MVDGDRSEWRPSAISTDAEMINIFRRFLTSTRSATAIGILTLLLMVLSLTPAVSQQSAQHSDRQQTEDASNRRFRSALAAYKAQRYAVAQRELDLLVKSVPNSFEANELLGLVYVAQDKQEQANHFLAKAVQLRPNVAEARTALATNLLAIHRAQARWGAGRGLIDALGYHPLAVALGGEDP